MLKNLKQLQVESNKRDANLYTTMFARMLNENSPATKVSFIQNISLFLDYPNNPSHNDEKGKQGYGVKSINALANV